MPESLRTRLTRYYFNLAPTYWCTGATIEYIAADWREVRVRLPLSLRTRNYVGTLYGGSMYAAVDPIYMLMLIQVLGSDYVVWDKAASIQFKKPGRSTLYAHFCLDQAEIDTIRTALTNAPSIDRLYTVELVDRGGVVHARVEKTIYVRRK
ncbi:MAG: DUF4442 domain-containing protein [Chloroflexi bacterium]|nr:DUF4442 domain-containing protein [Chloroflexota bacterium]